MAEAKRRRVDMSHNGSATFFTNICCPYAHRAMLALELRPARAALRSVNVPLTSQFGTLDKWGVVKADLLDMFVGKSLEDKAEFKSSVNPSGEVPALRLATGEVVAESEIVAEYFDATSESSSHKLVPVDPLAASRVRLVMKMFNPVVIPIVQLLKNQDPGKDAQLAEQLNACLEKFVLRLGTESGFCVGSVCTLADVHAVPFLWRFGFLVKHFRGYDIFQAHPRLALLAKSFEEMPEFQAVMKREGLTKEKLIPMYALYANDSRWSEDGTVMVGRGKSTFPQQRVFGASMRSRRVGKALNQLRVALLSRREEACRCVLSSLLAGQLESLVLGVFTAWRNVKAAQLSAAEEAARAAAAASEASNAGEATELRRQLDSLHAEAIDAQRSVAEARAASIRHESTMAQELLLARATAACLSLREEASRKVIASLLASRLVLLVRGAFHAWQHACNGEDPEKAAEELGALRRQVSDAAAAKVTAVAAREEGQAALQSSQALAEHLSVSVDDLQKKVAALEAEARQAAQLRIELQKAEEEAREVKASQWDLRCTAAMLSRRERASRTVIASLMASHMELMLQGTFCAWRDALAGNQQVEAAAKLQLALDSSKGDLETQALELAKLQKEVSEAAKLRHQLDETASQ
ncbi:unnamed protein product, partial [Polarella glacialis]